MNLRPFVLWISEPGPGLVRPTCLFTAAMPKQLRDWRQANTWASQIPCVAFGSDELKPFGTPFQAPTDDGIPWRVENAPEGAWGELPPLGPWVPRAETTFAARLAAEMAFACRCVVAAPKGPLWHICADADDGILAIAIARVRRHAVALSSGPPGILAAGEANRYGVDITYRHNSGDVH